MIISVVGKWSEYLGLGKLTTTKVFVMKAHEENKTVSSPIISQCFQTYASNMLVIGISKKSVKESQRGCDQRSNVKQFTILHQL